jgi:N-acetylglucosamine kinase-like BadF-type ATPase
MGRFSDWGGGAMMGQLVLAAATSHLCGLPRQHLLVKLICRRYRIGSGEVLSHFQPINRREVAALARLALEAYEMGDRAGKHIVRITVEHQVRMVLEVMEELKFRRGVRIFASGGLFKSQIIRRLFKAKITRSLQGPRVTIVDDPLMLMLGRLMKENSRKGSGTDS